MNENIKNLLSDNSLSSNYNLKQLNLLLNEYQLKEIELNDINKDLQQSLSNLESEIQPLNFNTQKGIKNYVCEKALVKTIDDLTDDLLEKKDDESMSNIDKIYFDVYHVKHVDEVVVLLRYMINRNSIYLLEVKDMISFLKEKRVNWIRVY